MMMMIMMMIIMIMLIIIIIIIIINDRFWFCVLSNRVKIFRFYRRQMY